MRSLAAVLLTLSVFSQAWAAERAYVVVDTGQERCYDDRRAIRAPVQNQPCHGQDAQHIGPKPSYKDNGNGTVSDLNTGLMWVKARGLKVTWDAAVAGAGKCRVGGHTDWRMPTIKELYSLINFTGGCTGRKEGSRPYLDTRFFEFAYGNEAQGERIIDCQDWTATEYVRTTMNGNATVFGVNFADGRIKGYPKMRRRPPGGRGQHPPRGHRPPPRGPNAQGKATPHVLYVRYVRGNPQYGKNDLKDNGNGTISDRATGLMWSKADSGKGLNWQQALAWVQQKNANGYLGHTDWRLPNAKELHSIVDYTRVPAIDPVFQITKLPDGDHPFFWTGTSHLEGPPDRKGTAAVYIAFGRGTGWMSFPPGRGTPQLMDVHGAGCQRSDPKSGDPAAFPHGRGPQGDVIRIYNFVRLVRGGTP